MWVQVEHKSLFQSQFFTKNLRVPNLKIQKQLIKYVAKAVDWHPMGLGFESCMHNAMWRHLAA
jgi:hypothetical protein